MDYSMGKLWSNAVFDQSICIVQILPVIFIPLLKATGKPGHYEGTNQEYTEFKDNILLPEKSFK